MSYSGFHLQGRSGACIRRGIKANGRVFLSLVCSAFHLALWPLLPTGRTSRSRRFFSHDFCIFFACRDGACDLVSWFLSDGADISITMIPRIPPPGGGYLRGSYEAFRVIA